jgi:hypothetical protein
MSFRKLLICTLAVFCLPTVSIAKDLVTIQNGFLTGERLMTMSSPEQKAYTMGIVNGILISPYFGAEGKEIDRIKKCLTGMSDSQLVAIHINYLQKNPATWHQTPHVSFLNALIEVCPKAL